MVLRIGIVTGVRVVWVGLVVSIWKVELVLLVIMGVDNINGVNLCRVYRRFFGFGLVRLMCNIGGIDKIEKLVLG